MEIQIRFHIGVGIMQAAIHHGDGFSHGAQQLFLNSGSSQAGNLRLQYQPQLRQVRQPFLLVDADHQIQRLPNRMGSPIRHERAAPRIGLDQALFTQGLHCFAHRSAAYSKALGQVALRRQLVPRLELAFQNGVFHLLHNLLVLARRLYRPVHWLGGYRIKRFDCHLENQITQIRSISQVGIAVQTTYHTKPVYWIQTVLMFTNSRIPCTASSRPWPEYFTPPNGKRGSEDTILFRKTMPASSSLMNLSVSAGSLVQALAPRPKRLSLAIWMA